jgi:hypothetical protein
VVVQTESTKHVNEMDKAFLREFRLAFPFGFRTKAGGERTMDAALPEVKFLAGFPVITWADGRGLGFGFKFDRTKIQKVKGRWSLISIKDKWNPATKMEFVPMSQEQEEQALNNEG